MRVRISSEERPNDRRITHQVDVIQAIGAAEQILSSRTGDSLTDAARKVVRTMRDQADEAERLLRAMGLLEPEGQGLAQKEPR